MHHVDSDQDVVHPDEFDLWLDINPTQTEQDESVGLDEYERYCGFPAVEISKEISAPLNWWLDK